ncbi:hypothetical protein KI387_041523 [Taxus chinensis]|uniref:Probable purine permease n=1 Tax=Taxus chinensis TaxID=29808 RepID=A0AA38F8I0_TAXCH|nr:hypothetical protein KI387_041523 [Taxus chinensis]
MERKNLLKCMMLLLNLAALSIGTSAGPLLLKFYFMYGKREWLCAFIQTAGWPILIVPIWVSSTYNKKQGYPDTFHVTPRLCLASIGIGLLTGLQDFLYAWGLRYLPISTSALLNSSQLGFNAGFAYLIVRQKFTPYSINAVILLSLGTVMLSFNTRIDKPKEVTHANYIGGFAATMCAAALYGLILPVIEFVYGRTRRQITYTLVMEMQLIMSFSASVLCAIGMTVNNDFMAIPMEAKTTRLGELCYYIILVWIAISWQLFFIGVFGVIFLKNSLLSGIIIAVFIPVNQVLAVFVYHEKFSGEKGIAMVLALWGFASYLYGEQRYSKDLEEGQQGLESANREEQEQTPQEQVD